MRYRVHRQERPRAHWDDQHLTVHGDTEDQARQLAHDVLGIPLDQIRLRPTHWNE